MKRKYVPREQYLERLSAFRDNTDFIKIVTGVRRCGKSVLMEQFRDILRSDGVPEDRIFSFNLEMPEYFTIRNGEDFTGTVLPKIPETGRCYVFFDEIQRIEGWERVVDSLTEGTDADIYVTGSNAHILSSELSTYLAGRYVNIEMFPLSFSEWKALCEVGMGDRDAFNKFMACGGFPAINPSWDTLSVNTSLRDIYASVVKWDIASRGQIRNMDELDRLVTYLMHNIGNSISLNSIVEGMGAGREMIGRYLNLLEEAFIIYRADRYDIQSTALGPHPKYYVVDQGIRDMAVGFTQKDSGRVLENIVYLELLRRGNTVQIGKYGAKEVDFVAFKTAGGREYYQVCLSIQNESTAERELSALRMTEDSFPKTVLTLDPVVRHITEDGILVMNVVEWLLGSL